jgi:hypothetical protein
VLRTAPGKTEALFFDHANTINIHQDDRYPGVPLFYIPNLTWNFQGNEKRKINKKINPTVRLCVFNGYEVCTKSYPCFKCELYIPREEDQVIIESVQLKEWNSEPDETDEIKKYVKQYQESEDIEDKDTAVSAIIKIAKQLKPIKELWLWVYKKLNDSKYSVNGTTLWSIARVMQYKPGWVYHAAKRIRSQQLLHEFKRKTK